jgi:cytochrome c oxidase subunit IV
MLQSLKNKWSAVPSHGSPDEVEHPHVMPLPIYFGVFGALLFLTVVTVGVSLLGLPPVLSLVVAVAVATVKATLVVLFFMHLRYENTFYSFIFVGSLFFMILFFLFTLGDFASRGFIIPQHATEYYRNEQINIKKEKALQDKAASESSSPASGSESPSP